MITFDNELYFTNTLRPGGRKSCDMRIRIKDWIRVWRQGGRRRFWAGPWGPSRQDCVLLLVV